MTIRIAAPIAVVALVLAFAQGSEGRAPHGRATAAASRLIARHPANARHTVVVGSKNFPEQFVLGEIYAQTLEAAGYKVRRKLGLANERTAFRALTHGRIGAYPEYTGIVLESFYGYSLSRVPRDASKSFAIARRRLAGDGIKSLPQAAANDTLALVLTRARADALGGPSTISGLAGKARALTIAGYPGCQGQAICLKGLARRYHLKFKRFRSTRSSPYALLDKGSADVAFAFTTDPELTTGRYALLRDNRRLFPSFHVTLLFDRHVLARLGPDAQRAVAQVQKPLTTAVLRELDARVVLDHQKPRAVAAAYLREAGFVK